MPENKQDKQQGRTLQTDAARRPTSKSKPTTSKVRRTPQTLAAEQSPRVPAQAPSRSKRPPSQAARRRAAENAQAQEIAAQKAAKKESAQRVAAELAQKNAATHPSAAPQCQRKQNQKPAQAKNTAQAKKSTQSQTKRKQSQPTKRVSGSQKPPEKRKQGKGAVPVSAPAPSKTKHKQGKNAAAQQTNHAPMFDQYDGTPSVPVVEKSRKRNKKEKVMNQASARRNRCIRNGIAMLFLVVLIGVGIVYSMQLLFKVQSIEVQSPEGTVPANTGIYTEAIILAKLQISIGDNFFSFSTAEQEQILQEALPLLEHIEVLRDYPNTILVRLEPAVETYTMEIAGGWLVLSESLHVMSTVSEQPNLTVLRGAEPSSYVAGQSLAFVQSVVDTAAPVTTSDGSAEDTGEAQAETALTTQEQQAQSDAQVLALSTLLTALEDAELLADITELAFEGESGISFLYQDRIAVLIGTTNSLDYKLSLVQYIVWNKNGDGCAETDTGLLDVSYQSADGTITPTFAQGDVVFPIVSSSAADTDLDDDATVTEDETETESDDTASEDALTEPDETTTQ